MKYEQIDTVTVTTCLLDFSLIWVLQSFFTLCGHSITSLIKREKDIAYGDKKTCSIKGKVFLMLWSYTNRILIVVVSFSVRCLENKLTFFILSFIQERIQLETSRLYKQAGVNPLAGKFSLLQSAVSSLVMLPFAISVWSTYLV